MKNIKHRVLAALVVGVLTTASGADAFAQASGGTGVRTVKNYWIESGQFFSVTPTVPFDNPAGCTTATGAIVPASHPAYKQLLAAVMHAMATNTPISGWVVGCYSYWGQTFPSIVALGVGQ